MQHLEFLSFSYLALCISCLPCLSCHVYYIWLNIICHAAACFASICMHICILGWYNDECFYQILWHQDHLCCNFVGAFIAAKNCGQVSYTKYKLELSISQGKFFTQYYKIWVWTKLILRISFFAGFCYMFLLSICGIPMFFCWRVLKDRRIRFCIFIGSFDFGS